MREGIAWGGGKVVVCIGVGCCWDGGEKAGGGDVGTTNGCGGFHRGNGFCGELMCSLLGTWVVELSWDR